MTHTCTDCREVCCDKMGQDLRACEHYVRFSDVEPEPPAAVLGPTVGCPFHDQCSEIVTRLRKVERALCDIGRAVDGELL